MSRAFPRIVYLGMYGRLSLEPLRALISAGCEIVGVCVSANELPGSKPIGWRPATRKMSHSHLLAMIDGSHNTAVTLAHQHKIPVFEIGNLHASQVYDGISKLSPDVICVSCFPKRIPEKILNLPTYGCLNLHPSKLPLLRGPVPLFWLMQQGFRQGAVTVHWMDRQLDHGPIAVQAEFALEDGMRDSEIEALHAEHGARLMGEAVLSLTELHKSPQPQVGLASYFGWPTADDFVIDETWSARRVFNFMRGTGEWGRPYRIHQGEQIVVAREAIAYWPDAADSPAIKVRTGQKLLRLGRSRLLVQ